MPNYQSILDQLILKGSVIKSEWETLSEIDKDRIRMWLTKNYTGPVLKRDPETGWWHDNKSWDKHQREIEDEKSEKDLEDKRENEFEKL